MYTPSPEEQRLVEEYSEAATTKKVLAWSAAGAGLVGLAVLPEGLFLWALAAILAVIAARTKYRLHRISGRVSTLRAFPTPNELAPGSLVSLIPDPYGLSGDRLVGRVGSASKDGGDAEIVSKPLGGKQWVSKHSGSFTIAKGDWVVFHREENGDLTIWQQGPQFRSLVESAEQSGDKRSKKLAQLQKLTHAQGRATQALQDLFDAQQDISNHETETHESTDPRPPTVERRSDAVPEVWTKEDIIGRFGITEQYFAVKYQTYTVALRMSGKTSNWNDDVDEIARAKGALTEREIALARTDFHQALLNRVKLALTMGQA